MSAIIDDQLKRSRKHQGIVPSRYHERKAPVDRTIALVLLILFAPVLALLIILVRATSSGGGIYPQLRVGKNGREFWLYKVRTMYANAEADGPQWAKPNDTRTTPVGRALRFLHLDELPQLINVVRGDMSLIGPRPERPEFVSDLALVVPNYEERLKVLPGITGLAQINLPADDSLASVEKKVTIDCHYIEKGDPYLDFRILICTALRMMGIRHGRAPRWLGVEYRFSKTTRSLVDTMEMSLDETVVGIRALVHGANGENGDVDESGDAAAFEYSTAAAGLAAFSGSDRRTTPRRPK